MTTSLKKEPNNEDQRNTILPSDPISALNIMTNITRQMLEFVLEEGRLLKKKDSTVLTSIQKGKELRAEAYARASEEFKDRLEEFRGLSEDSIGKLEALTVQLGKATRENQKLIEAMAPTKPLNENLTNNLFLLQGEEVAGTAE